MSGVFMSEAEFVGGLGNVDDSVMVIWSLSAQCDIFGCSVGCFC